MKRLFESILPVLIETHPIQDQYLANQTVWPENNRVRFSPVEGRNYREETRLVRVTVLASNVTGTQSRILDDKPCFMALNRTVTRSRSRTILAWHHAYRSIDVPREKRSKSLWSREKKVFDNLRFKILFQKHRVFLDCNYFEDK